MAIMVVRESLDQRHSYCVRQNNAEYKKGKLKSDYYYYNNNKKRAYLRNTLHLLEIPDEQIATTLGILLFWANCMATVKWIYAIRK